MNSVWTLLPCCFSKDFLKSDFLDIYLTKVFRVDNFGNTSAMRVIYFLGGYSKLNIDFKNAERNAENVLCF